MHPLINKAVDACQWPTAKERAEFVFQLQDLEDDVVEDWARLVSKYYPECDARELLIARSEIPHIEAILAHAPRAWWAEQTLEDLPRDMTPYFFAQLVARDFDLGDMFAVFDVIPSSPHRLAIIDAALEMQKALPEFDIVHFKGMDFAPMPFNPAGLSPEDVLPRMQALSKMTCLLCRANKPCSLCSYLPQQTGVFHCIGTHHFCPKCTQQCFTTCSITNGQCYDLTGAVFTVNGTHVDFTRGSANVPWTRPVLTRLSLVVLDSTRVLLGSDGSFLNVYSLAFHYVEEREMRRKSARITDLQGGIHEFRPTSHNGEPITWWAWIVRYACPASALPTTRLPNPMKFVAWGRRDVELKRVRV